MITSLLSDNKDIVGLYPVKHLTAEKLHEMTLNVIHALTECGYRVLSLISDNNRVNRKMFQKLCNGALKSKFKNPYKPDEDIFILFDTVHLLKSIINNWLNQKDTEQTFTVPPLYKETETEPQPSTSADNSQVQGQMTNENKTPLEARLGDLKKLYTSEAEDIVKLAPFLSKKVLYPSSIERQNVVLAVKLFDEKT